MPIQKNANMAKMVSHAMVRVISLSLACVWRGLTGVAVNRTDPFACGEIGIQCDGS